MKKLLILLLLSQGLFAQTSTMVVPIKISYAKSNPPQAILIWNKTANTTSTTVYQKKVESSDWTVIANLSGNDTTYSDTSFRIGKAYEYMVKKVVSGNFIYGVISAGIEIPAEHDRGYGLIICDSNLYNRLKNQIEDYKMDMIRDGYKVKLIFSQSTESVVSIKHKIIDWYSVTNSSEKHSIVLFGNVPIPYSGDLNPDAHPDHKGAWPADCFYADIDNETWDDVSINNSVATRSENKNIPGDGKYDFSSIPNPLRVAVGRVFIDSFKLTGFGLSTDSLYKRYLKKVQTYKRGLISIPQKACIEDRLNALGGEWPGRNVYQNANALVAPDSIVEAPNNFLNKIRSNKFIFAQVSSTGGYNQVISVANSSQVKDSMGAVFQGYFGSYFGDWDIDNNFLRSSIAGDGVNLTSVWAGRPQWYFHHMASGYSTGFATIQTQNNFIDAFHQLYYQGASASGVHIALMGDPNLRMHNMTTPSNLIITKVGNNTEVQLNWTTSNNPNHFYFIYRADSINGKFTKIDSTAINASSYIHRTPKLGKSVYMVKACNLQNTHVGSYYNLSLGVYNTVDSVQAKPIVVPNAIETIANNCIWNYNSMEKTITIQTDFIGDIPVNILNAQGAIIQTIILKSNSSQPLNLNTSGVYYAYIINTNVQPFKFLLTQ